MIKNYSLKACENLIDIYLQKGGEVKVLEDGVLGLGKVLLTGNGLKTIIIQEFFISAWSSGHKIKKYNKTPKIYLLN